MKRRQNFWIILLVVALMTVYTIYEANKPQPVDWSMNFSVDKKGPFGTYIMKDALPYMFPEGKTTVSRVSPRERLRLKDSDEPEVYFFVNRYFKNANGEADILLDYVGGGNTLFLSAEYIPDTLLSVAGVKEVQDFREGNDYIRGFGKAYPFRVKHRYFKLEKSFAGEILGYVDTVTMPNFIRLPYGEGVLYLHVNPVAFTNLYLLDSLAGDYYQKALSFLPADLNAIWDEYQKNERKGQATPFRVLLQYPALKWAYILLLLGGILYVLFRSKREQRYIPVIRPPENRTLEFVGVVSSLYYKHRDHVAIANKRIDCFLEEIRYYYKLRTDELNAEFAVLLAERSGVPKEETEKLVNLILLIRKTEHVNEEKLRELVKYIELFKTKR